MSNGTSSETAIYPDAQAARTARRATTTEHGRMVEDLMDDFNEAVQADDLRGFFERLAVRLIGPRP